MRDRESDFLLRGVHTRVTLDSVEVGAFWQASTFTASVAAISWRAAEVIEAVGAKSIVWRSFIQHIGRAGGDASFERVADRKLWHQRFVSLERKIARVGSRE